MTCGRRAPKARVGLPFGVQTMSMWIILAACGAAGLAAQALDVGTKLRLAFVAVQWGALALVGLRVASFGLGAVA